MSLLPRIGWQQVVGRSRVRHAAFLAGCWVLMLSLAYFAHLRALFVEVESAAEQSQRLTIEQTEKEARAQVLTSNQAQLAAAYRRLDQSRWMLAAGGELAGLLEDITEQGQSHGVFVEQMELLPEIQHDQYVEQPMQLQLRGAFAALAGFALGLAQLPRLITLDDFTVLPAEAQAPGGLRMQANVSAYRSRVASPASVVPSSEEGAARLLSNFSRSPFEPLLSMQHRQHLETLALDQFEMVGSLARRQVRFALLRAAGVVHRLQVGDRLGRDKGRIVHIEEQHVEINEEVFVAGKGLIERRRTLRLRAPAGTR